MGNVAHAKTIKKDGERDKQEVCFCERGRNHIVEAYDFEHGGQPPHRPKKEVFTQPKTKHELAPVSAKPPQYFHKGFDGSNDEFSDGRQDLARKIAEDME